MLDLGPLERLRRDNEQKAIVALRGICLNHSENSGLINISLNIFPNHLYFLSGDDPDTVSSFLQVIQGTIKPSSGQIFFQSNLKKAYLNLSALNKFSSLSLKQIVHFLIDEDNGFDEYLLLKQAIGLRVNDRDKLERIKRIDQLKFLWILGILQKADLILADGMMKGLSLEEQVELLSFIKDRMNKRAMSILFLEESLEITKHIKSDVLIFKDGIIQFRMRS